MLCDFKKNEVRKNFDQILRINTPAAPQPPTFRYGEPPAGAPSSTPGFLTGSSIHSSAMSLQAGPYSNEYIRAVLPAAAAGMYTTDPGGYARALSPVCGREN